MAGIIGAACMTVVRGAARRAGWIEKTVPQVIEERVTEPLRRREGEGSDLHELLDQVMHLGYGAAMGAAYGFALGDREHHAVLDALGLGVGTWAVGTALVGAIGAGRPAWRRSATENAVDLTAHLVFGFAAELARVDLETHSEAGPVSSAERLAAHTG